MTEREKEKGNECKWETIPSESLSTDSKRKSESEKVKMRRLEKCTEQFSTVQNIEHRREKSCACDSNTSRRSQQMHLSVTWPSFTYFLASKASASYQGKISISLAFSLLYSILLSSHSHVQVFTNSISFFLY